MKEKIKTFFCAVILLLGLPVILTMLLQSDPPKQEAYAGHTEEEVYVLGMLAKEIPVTMEEETLKAQALIARTNLRAAKELKQELPQGLTRAEMIDLWGEQDFPQYYGKLTKAVEDTKGKTLQYQGEYIYAAYHRVSAGKTRNAVSALGTEKMPWLVTTDSMQDIPSEHFLKVIFLDKKEFSNKIKAAFPESILDEENPLSSIRIESRDEGEYVVEMKIGESAVSGEAFRNGLELNSACFFLKEVEGEIRIVTKGLGHGLGMSQYGANVLAQNGKSYQEILHSYFKNMEIAD